MARRSSGIVTELLNIVSEDPITDQATLIFNRDKQ